MIKQPENLIYHWLASSPSVAKIVGFRIFPTAVPTSADFPFVVYKRSNISREHTLGSPLYMPQASTQVASWALTYDEARKLADEVRLVLDGATGSGLGVTIHDIRLVSETDDYLDPTTVGAQLPPAYETRQLFQVRWSESTQ